CQLIHLKIILWNKPLEIGLCNKADVNQTLSQNRINSIKQFLVVLAHQGFSENKCIHKGCIDYSLNGINICLNHFGYKFST
ncbi:hypothetical protein AbaMCR8683_15365, partial [Acinetobacter baumannii]